MFVVVFSLLFLIFFILADDALAGCEQQAAMEDSIYSQLYSQLEAESNGIIREDMMKQFIESQKITRGFNSTQTVGILDLFENEISREEVLELMSPFILGIRCRDAVLFLNRFANSFNRMDALKNIVNLIVDLRANNETLVDTFQNTFSKQDAREVIANAKAPRSCVWGDVADMKRGVFIIDTSGSMSAQFTNDGIAYNRLSFVTKQLANIINNGLTDEQEFNIISFSNSASAWSPGVVPVTASNIASATQFLGSRSPGGGTNMISAVKLALSDPKATSIYLLSDGQPNGGSSEQASIISACQAWNKQTQGPVNTVAFFAGGPPDANAASFMEKLATATGGIYRKIGK